MKLWAHQQQAIEFGRAHRHLALFMEAGTGKTGAAINILREEYNSKKRIVPTLIVAPLSVCPQWKKEFAAFSKVPQEKILVLTGARDKRIEELTRLMDAGGNGIVATNYEATLIKPFYERILTWGPKILLLDECFGGETLVDTPHGRTPIRNICRGDKVFSAIGISEVKDVTQRYPQDICTIRIQGQTIRVSWNHPFFTRGGWKSAGDLTEGDEIIRTSQAMRILWGEIHGWVPLAHKEYAFLFWELCQEIGKSYVQSSSSEEIKRHTNKYGPLSAGSWGKWSWSNTPGVYNLNYDPSIKLESCCSNKNATIFGLPHLLQTGFSLPPRKTRGRDRWAQPQYETSENAGQKEDRFFEFARVESSPVYERRSSSEARGDCFYDLEIDGHPSFSVNGLLVHNCHKVKDAASQRSKKLYPLAQAADRRIGLTGTPILNSELDLFGQFKLIDPTIFGNNFFTFRMKYFYDKNSFMPKHIHFPNWQARPETKKELGEIVAKHSIQAKKSECLDLPPFLEIPVEVPLSAKQQKAYEDMQKDFVAEVKNNVSTAEFAMTKTLRLQQILCGFIQPDDADEAVWLDDIPRLEALKDTLESLGKAKVIVWTTFRATYPKIKKVCDGLGLTSAFLIGGQSAKQNEQAIQDFRFGDTQVLISNPAAGGTGINLTEAPYAIYYHKGYSLEHFVQSSARNFRGGSTMHKQVTHYHLFSPGTLDQIIHNCLLDKQDTAMAVLNWAKVIALNMKG